MNRLLQKLSDVKDMRNIHGRHIVQSVLIFSCFCTVDTLAKKNDTVWLISAAAVIAAIITLMLLLGKIRVDNRSNALNIIGAGLCVGCHFLEALYPVAIFFITLTAGIRLAYARDKVNDYCTLMFLIISVLSGIIIRFALVYLPVWSLGIIMLATVFNPVLERGGADGKRAGSAELSGKKTKVTLTAASVMLGIFFLCIEIFGGPLTDEVAHSFPMGMVNFTYIAGYIFFVAVIFTLRIKYTSIAVMMLSILALFFFLLPPTTEFGIYFLLFSGGGAEVLMLAFPVTLFNKKYKYLGAIGGVFIYRLAFLFRGIAKAAAGDAWHISSGLTYALAAMNIVLGVGLIFLLGFWDRRDAKVVVEDKFKGQIAEMEDKYKGQINELIAMTAPKPFPDYLTAREKEIGAFILEGLKPSEIAERLFISEWTVKDHIKKLLEKTESESQKDFVIKFIK